MEAKEFQALLQTKVSEIEEILKSCLPKEKGFQKTVLEAMNYSILAGGKRLRPMLMQETYRMFGGSGDVVKPFMAAMEMIDTSASDEDAVYNLMINGFTDPALLAVINQQMK